MKLLVPGREAKLPDPELFYLKQTNKQTEMLSF